MAHRIVLVADEAIVSPISDVDDLETLFLLVMGPAFANAMGRKPFEPPVDIADPRFRRENLH